MIQQDKPNYIIRSLLLALIVLLSSRLNAQIRFPDGFKCEKVDGLGFIMHNDSVGFSLEDLSTEYTSVKALETYAKSRGFIKMEEAFSSIQKK